MFDIKTAQAVVSDKHGNRKREVAPIGALNTTFGQVVSDPLRPDTLPVPLGPINVTDFGAFEAVTLQDVQKLLRQVNPRKATGSDSVPGLVLREAAYVLAPSLLDILNVSFLTGCVPAAFKKSNVVPLYKSGDSCRATNYRPVSLLPIVSHLLEKVVQAQFTCNLNRRNLFPGTQFAYRNNHSTEDALVYAVNRWQGAKQKRQTTGTVMVDMSNAFDRVGHSKLIAYLHSLGILVTALAWFCSYLSCRVQRVKIGLKISSEVKCTQGSVLGPLLFVVYTRGLHDILPRSICLQEFDDDIIIDTSHPDPHVVTAKLSDGITCLADWLKDRGLLLNQSKTQVMFIKQRGVMVISGIVNCRGAPLVNVSTVKYLGVLIDDDLH